MSRPLEPKPTTGSQRAGRGEEGPTEQQPLMPVTNNPASEARRRAKKNQVRSRGGRRGDLHSAAPLSDEQERSCHA